MSLRVSEWICLGYFAWIVVLSFFIPQASGRRWPLLVANVVLAAAVWSLRAAPRALRDWMPVAWILIGYHEAGRLTFPRTDGFFEKMLLCWDRRLFGQMSSVERTGWLDVVLEFLYLQCYSIVPLGVGLLYLAHRTRFADYYWSNVLGSAFLSYGLTPLFPALPPRRLGIDGAEAVKRSPLRKFSLWISDHWSIKVNSFPSGHAAAAVAATLVMLRILPAAGICYVVVAIGILLASVRGKYHYAVDALAGTVVALGVFLACPGS